MKKNPMMSDDFCAFILTHGRPDKVITYKTLRKSGYTGKIYVVIDDEDKTAEQYKAKYGAEVLQFSKSEVAKQIDEGDNFQDRRVILYARNACFDLARQVGCKYFIQLDDDYNWFSYRYGRNQNLLKTTMDDCITLMLEYYKSISALSISMSQSGDHMGNSEVASHPLKARRKCMNSFICSTDRPFRFAGRINEDVNAYTTLGRTGGLFLTVMPVQLNQGTSQANTGGMTDIYLDSGTYIKSFYTVMYCPSEAQIGILKDPHALSGAGRIHHKLNWHKIAPKILPEEYKKNRASLCADRPS